VGEIIGGMRPTTSARRARLPLLSLALLAALAAAGAARAADPAPGADPEVRRFVVAVRYADIYRATASGIVARAGKPANAEDAKFQKFMRRVAALPPAQLVPPIATVFSQRLTGPEAGELADFFESPTGRKIADLSVARAQTGESAQAFAKRVTVTEEDKAAYARFAATDVYKKYSGIVTDKALGTAMVLELARMPAFADVGLAPPAEAR
jgi:hypothetical protein